MRKKNVLFSDANHGGLILLEEYHKFTNNNLFFYDVYDKLSDDEKRELGIKFGVEFLSLEDIKSSEDSFVKVNPVHMPPVIGTDYTHHEFVDYLLKKNNFSFRIIQVTGVKGKTSVATMLSHILEDFNTLVLTSSTLMYNGKVLMEHLSITPASIVLAINRAKEENIIDCIDFCIFEVSLGVVPNNFLNILTNVLEDYPIAGRSSSASVAKESVFSSKMTLCDYGSFVKYYSNHDAVTLSFDDSDADIFADNIEYSLDESRFVMNYFDSKYEIYHFALSDFYINNLLFAIAAGFMLGIDKKVVISKLSKVNNIKGRNSYRKIDNRTVIEDINPGLNASSIKKCIDNLDKHNEEALIIMGGDYGITCEEINEKKLTEYIDGINNTQIIFAGEVGKSLAEQVKVKYKTFNSLKDAITYSLEKEDNKIIQIIYRSEYKKHDEDLNYFE
ncbi:MAG: hypothetical protein BZ138_04305 [Methanosphaera sp. rholeuAM270]|nr:MAG: hypothetical protein BZ138_04305 [Methanosphaera sp. rholeuAM270]